MPPPTLSAADVTVRADLVQETRSIWAGLLPASVRETGVALLDFPAHQNVGDSMIWRGEEEHLRELRVPIRYRADRLRFAQPRLDELAPNAPILLHGGGNFGDIWDDYQAFREQLVSATPLRKIVQLPQSIWFNDPANAVRANAVFGAHPDFTLLVREEQSLELAASLLPDVRTYLCPDASFGMRTPITGRGAEGPLSLLRNDREASVDRAQSLSGIEGRRLDWGLSGASRLAWRTVRVPGRLHRMAPRLERGLYPLVSRGYESMATINLRAGSALVGSASCILTNRLHAHILASLLGIPHVVMDNVYGKVGAVFRTHTHRFSGAHFAATPCEAVEAWTELARKLASASGSYDR